MVSDKKGIMQLIGKAPALVASAPTIQNEGTSSLDLDEASQTQAQSVEQEKQPNSFSNLMRRISSLNISAIVRPKSAVKNITKPLPGGIEAPISFERYMQMTKRGDVWSAFLERVATFTPAQLALLHSNDFVMDVGRHAFVLNETIIGAEVSEVDTFMLSELMKAGLSDERSLHILRYLFQDLMHQGLFTIDRKVIDSYQTRYFESDMNLGGFGYNPERLVKAKLADSISFRSENKKMILCAIQYWQAVPNGSPTLEPAGFDKLTVELVFDLSKLDNKLWLLTPGCCTALAKFQGFSKELC